MSQPAARLTDMHTCPMQTPAVPPVPHVGGPITGPGATTALIGGLPAARVSDICTCTGPPDSIVKGSATVMIAGLPAARQGDLTAHGGVIAGGLPKVLIGDQGSGSAAGGAGALAGRSVRGVADTRVSQRATLADAAVNGTPFCEECERARLAERTAPTPSPARDMLVDAAANGTPFCAECEQARLAEQADPTPDPSRQALVDSARAGTPFCEECERARAALAE